MIPGRVISFNEDTGYGYVKIMDTSPYLDYKEMWFSYTEVQGDRVKRGDAVNVWLKELLGVMVVDKVEKANV